MLTTSEVPEIFTAILGERWIHVTEIIKILAVYGVLRAIASVLSTLFLSLKKQNYIAAMTFFRVLTLLITIIPFTLRWGVIGVSYSVLLSVIVELLLTTYYLIHVLKYLVKHE